MRSCDIKSSLKRAQKLAQRLNKGDSDLPEEFKSLRIAYHLSQWYFNSLVPGLVYAPTAEEENDGRQLIYKGKDLLDKSNEYLYKANEILSEIRKYGLV